MYDDPHCDRPLGAGHDDAVAGKLAVLVSVDRNAFDAPAAGNAREKHDSVQPAPGLIALGHESHAVVDAAIGLRFDR